mmetsp:Transcript_19996/g.28998  ORF Transcript_19996/g.28998 Transcript_19996/m.28998 type:complete len:891 (-) Transcript_19996:1842-4514(-)
MWPNGRMLETSNSNNENGNHDVTVDIVTHTISDIDNQFKPLGCLGHGRFGSVYLAEKKSKSKRKVALKVMRIDPTNEKDYETFTRELDAVMTLNDTSIRDGVENDPRSQYIVFFEDWFVGPNFACIVMKHADGGTLSSVIHNKSQQLSQLNSSRGENIMNYLFSERRIAWYASQLCEALSYAHFRGLAHHDVKSSNVLIDGSSGGKLLLVDFDSALKQGEEAVGFTRSFAPPELLASHELDDYSNLQPDRIDAFGLGCILYELVTCQRLEDNSGQNQTLAQYIDQHGLDAALNHSGCLKLPWLPDGYDPQETQCGYSGALRSLIKTLLHPDPEERWLPSQLKDPFRKDPNSPLLTPTVVAAQTASTGDIITMDNVQLGMFVMRGPDWDDAENGQVDGFCKNSCTANVGVVVELDPDTFFCNVAFPSRLSTLFVEPAVFRIGSQNKFELIAAPTPVDDFCSEVKDGKRWNGLVRCAPEMNIDSIAVGQMPDNNYQIVGVDNDRRVVMVAPTQMCSLPPTRPFDRFVESHSFAGPHTPLEFPEEWQWLSGENRVQLMELSNDSEERANVVDQFHCMDEGGLDRARFHVISVKRVHNEALWKKYAVTRETVAMENWGMPNIERLFHGLPVNESFSPEMSPEMRCHSNKFLDSNLFHNIKICPYPCTVHQGCGRASNNEWKSYPKSERQHQMFLSRVILGRVNNNTHLPHTARRDNGLKYHSHPEVDTDYGKENKYYNCTNPTQLYPEYIITYRKQAVASTRQLQENLVSLSICRSSAPAGSVLNPSTQRLSNKASMKCSGIAKSRAENRVIAGCSATEATASISSSSPRVKRCVICLSNPVKRILLPCGHPCLCDDCSTGHNLRKLHQRGGCPECRAPFTQVAHFYGKILMDD